MVVVILADAGALLFNGLVRRRNRIKEAWSDPAKIGPGREHPVDCAALIAVAENYPQLRAVESFLQVQEQLTATEDKLEYARRYYNTSARDCNRSPHGRTDRRPETIAYGKRLDRRISQPVRWKGTSVTAIPSCCSRLRRSRSPSLSWRTRCQGRLTLSSGTTTVRVIAGRWAWSAST